MFKKSISFVFIVFLSSLAFTQTQFGRISGKVTDKDNNNGISSVTVYLFQGDVQKQSARTNTGGNFSFVNVLPDAYTIKTSKTGYFEFSKPVRVNPNFTTKLFLSLTPISSGSSEAEPKSAPVRVYSNQQTQKKKTEIIEPTQPANTIAENHATDSIKTTPENESSLEAIKTDELVFIEAPQEMPEPIDGWNSLYKKVVFPEIALRQKATGTVVLSVYIDKNGEVISIEVLKGAHPALDKAAQDAVYETKFKPGKQEGRPVDTKIAVPIKFK